MRWFFLFFVLFPTWSNTAEAKSSKRHSDQQLKTIVRKKAPFFLQDSDGEIRLNKDGSVMRDATGGTMTKTGKWKVEKGNLKLTFSNGAPEKSYSLEIGSDGAPTLNGTPLNAGRVHFE